MKSQQQNAFHKKKATRIELDNKEKDAERSNNSNSTCNTFHKHSSLNK